MSNFLRAHRMQVSLSFTLLSFMSIEYIPRGMGYISEETIATPTQGQIINSRGTELDRCQGMQCFFTFSLSLPTTSKGILKLGSQRSAWSTGSTGREIFLFHTLSPLPLNVSFHLLSYLLFTSSSPFADNLYNSVSFYSRVIRTKLVYSDLDRHLGGRPGGGGNRQLRNLLRAPGRCHEEVATTELHSVMSFLKDWRYVYQLSLR